MKISKQIKSLLLEASVDKINYNGISYKMVIDVTEAETKEGVRIKFTPMATTVVASKDDIANIFQQKINDKLQPMGLSVSIDNDGLDENTISFLLPVTQLVSLIKTAFDSNEKQETPNPEGDI